MRLPRPGRTQQRIAFDIDWAGRYLATGGTVCPHGRGMMTVHVELLFL
jgi:hypothetical protein